MFVKIQSFKVIVLSVVLSASIIRPVTVAERSKAWTLFARSESGIVGSNPSQGMDVWCVYMCLFCV
jgi:hypothetical protein